MFLQANPDRARSDAEKEDLAKVYRPGMSVLLDPETVRMRRRRSRRRRQRHESLQYRQREQQQQQQQQQQQEQEEGGRINESFLDVDDEDVEDDDVEEENNDYVMNDDDTGDYDSDEADRVMLEQVRELSLRQVGVSAERGAGDNADDGGEDTMLQLPPDARRSRSLDERRGAALQALAAGQQHNAQNVPLDNAPPSSRFSASTVASTASDRVHQYSRRSSSGQARSVSPVSRSNRSSRGTQHHHNRLSQQHQRRLEQQRQQPTARQVEHQASLRSLLSASEIDSQEIEDEIIRQVVEEGLLDGIDLRNIDGNQQDQIRDRVALAYQRRMEERDRAREQERRADGREGRDRVREREREREGPGRERQQGAGTNLTGTTRPSHDYLNTSSNTSAAAPASAVASAGNANSALHRRQRSENDATARAVPASTSTSSSPLTSHPPFQNTRQPPLPLPTSFRMQAQQQQSDPNVPPLSDQQRREQQRRHRDHHQHQNYHQHRSSSQDPPSSRTERRNRPRDILPHAHPAAMSMESVVLPRTPTATTTGASTTTIIPGSGRRRGSEQNHRTTDPEGTLALPDLAAGRGRREGWAPVPTTVALESSPRLVSSHPLAPATRPAIPAPDTLGGQNQQNHQSRLLQSQNIRGGNAAAAPVAPPPAVHVPGNTSNPRSAAGGATVEARGQPSPSSLSAAASPSQQTTRSSPSQATVNVGPPSPNTAASSAIASLPSQQRQHQHQHQQTTQSPSVNSTNNVSHPTLFPEPSVTCSRCKIPNIQYNLHYFCQICSLGNFALCMSCYRAGKGCLNWYGFGYAAWAKFEHLASGGEHPAGLQSPHVLMGRRYMKPKAVEIVNMGGQTRQQQQRRMVTEDPINMMQTGLFCDVCGEHTNKCYWRCEVCNSGAWGFCNSCVNRGRCCTHSLLPLMITNSKMASMASGSWMGTGVSELPAGQIEQTESPRSRDMLQVPSRNASADAAASALRQQQQQQRRGGSPGGSPSGNRHVGGVNVSANTAAAGTAWWSNSSRDAQQQQQQLNPMAAASLPAGFLGNSATTITATGGLPLSAPTPYMANNNTSLNISNQSPKSNTVPSLSSSTPFFTIRALTFTVSCDLCRYPIPPSLPRFHCQICSDGDYDVCTPCYTGLVTSGQLSAREGPDGWRICPARRHRMCVIGFEERVGNISAHGTVASASGGGGGAIGRYRFVVKEIVGGWAMRDEDVDVINKQSASNEDGDSLGAGLAGRTGSVGSSKRQKEKKWEWRDSDGTVRKMTMGLGAGVGVSGNSGRQQQEQHQQERRRVDASSPSGPNNMLSSLSSSSTTVVPEQSNNNVIVNNSTNNSGSTSNINPNSNSTSSVPTQSLPVPIPIPPSGGTGLRLVAFWSYFPSKYPENSNNNNSPANIGHANANTNVNANDTAISNATAATTATVAAERNNTNNNTNSNDRTKDDENPDNDELSFPRGAEIREVVDINGDWCWGRYAGRLGLFPGGYCRAC